MPDTGNAKLKVAFIGPFFVGNYWVLDHAEDYAWSIVGEGSRRFLWVLTREPVPSSDLQAELIERVHGAKPRLRHRSAPSDAATPRLIGLAHPAVAMLAPHPPFCSLTWSKLA